MNISEIVSPLFILNEAFKHPQLKITPRSQNIPDLQKATEIVLKTVQLSVQKHMADELAPALNKALLNYMLMNGEHATSGSKDEWEAGFDDVLERLLEPYVSLLSADWMGKNTIDSGAYDEDGVQKLCQSFGKEVFNTLTSEKTPAKVLSSAGIVEASILEALNTHLEKNRRENNMSQESEFDDKIKNIILTIRKHVGPDAEVFALYDDFSAACGDDDTLAVGACQRLGLGPAERTSLQVMQFQHGAKTVETLCTMFTEYKDPETQKPAAKKGRKKAEANPEALKVIPVFKALEETGLNAADMAVGLGVARQTYSKWLKGKQVPPYLDSKQLAYLGEEINKRLSALNGANIALAEMRPKVAV